MTKIEKAQALMNVVTFLRLCEVKYEYCADCARRIALAFSIAGASLKAIGYDDELISYWGMVLSNRGKLLEKLREGKDHVDFLRFIVDSKTHEIEFVVRTNFVNFR